MSASNLTPVLLVEVQHIYPEHHIFFHFSDDTTVICEIRRARSFVHAVLHEAFHLYPTMMDKTRFISILRTLSPGFDVKFEDTNVIRGLAKAENMLAGTNIQEQLDRSNGQLKEALSKVVSKPVPPYKGPSFNLDSTRSSRFTSSSPNPSNTGKRKR